MGLQRALSEGRKDPLGSGRISQRRARFDSGHVPKNMEEKEYSLHFVRFIFCTTSRHSLLHFWIFVCQI